AVVRWLSPYILWSTAIFALAVIGGYALVWRYPELIALFASPDLIASVERGQLWTEGLLNIVPSSVLSVQILANNIVVSLFAYCAALLFGLGTLYILGLNGLMLGAVFAFVSLHRLPAPPPPGRRVAAGAGAGRRRAPRARPRRARSTGPATHAPRPERALRSPGCARLRPRPGAAARATVRHARAGRQCWRRRGP